MTVYFVKCNEFVKIGYSSNPMQRVAQLQIGSPYPQEIIALMPGDITTEGELQGVFSNYQHSSEWFRLEGELLQFIEEMSVLFSSYAKKIKRNGNYVNERDWRYWKGKAIEAQEKLKGADGDVKPASKKKSKDVEILICEDCGKECNGVKGLNGHRAWCKGKSEMELVKANGHVR